MRKRVKKRRVILKMENLSKKCIERNIFKNLRGFLFPSKCTLYAFVLLMIKVVDKKNKGAQCAKVYKKGVTRC